MAKRYGSKHVATIRRKYRGKIYKSYMLRRSYRQEGKVKHQNLGNLSHLPIHIIEMIREALKGEKYIKASESTIKIIRSLPHGHVAAVLGALRKLKLENIINSRNSRERDLVVAMIVARVIDPASKLATARGLRDETMFNSLGQELGVETADEDNLYAAMDWIIKGQSRIEGKLAKLHLENGSLILYDVTSTYYTGTKCPLAKRGHNRDRKKGFPQIVFGLMCNIEGCPIAVKVFEGNVADPNTLSSQIKKIFKRFKLSRVIIVGDRGMLTSARIREELEPIDGLDWITALRAPAIRKLAEQDNIQPSMFDEFDLAEITSPDYPDERLVVCRNPILAAERTRKREDLLKATEKELDKIVAATTRRKRPLKGKDKIGLRVGKVLNRYKMGKHFKLNIGKKSFTYKRNADKIAAEASLDGIYVIRTNVKKKVLKAEDTVRAYKDLALVERAFRSLKMVDLKVRPIHHRLADRVRAHVFLCMLAYYVEWHMRKALAPILFDDDDKEVADRLRDSVVSPAKRSPRAQRKAMRKRTDQDEPVHSFQTLFEDLATLTKNLVRPKNIEPSMGVEYYEYSMATPLQLRAFELLGVTPNL